MTADTDALRSHWTHLYREHLPALAKARDPVQKVWPVYLDHCFARIVLDNAVGVTTPWTEVIKAPAVKHMSTGQLEAAILMAEGLANGEVNLREMDERSLELRGKKGKKRKTEVAEGNAAKKSKRARGEMTISGYFLPSPTSPSETGKGRTVDALSGEVELPDASSKDKQHEVDMSVQLQRIANSNITTFRRQMLTLLCEIPRGRYSTYQAMSDYITKTSHKTCARAVGSAMRNNPFAPQVPCHRVVAADGTIGGFNGHWGEQGKFASEKHRLLYEEGVRFDSKGKVKGPVFREFKM